MMPRQSVRRVSALPLLLLGLGLDACVLRPAWQKLADEQGLQAGRLETGSFEHLVLQKDGAGMQLRILVDGDGTPWLRDTRIAVDPTPANPVLLHLMADVEGPAVYLGRPCYFGTATNPECDARFWTHDRYGREVVDSMCIAVNELARRFAVDSVHLIGFSGGGTIVVAMASCTERAAQVSTVAGNLDPRAWTRYHGYSPLRDLTPLDAAMASRSLYPEIHWQCAADDIVPPAVTDAYFAAVAGAKRRIVDSCSHASGWQQYWSAIVESPVAR
jgi:pimeloyl-ACP methyl ester carboxylesterase